MTGVGERRRAPALAYIAAVVAALLALLVIAGPARAQTDQSSSTSTSSTSTTVATTTSTTRGTPVTTNPPVTPPTTGGPPPTPPTTQAPPDTPPTTVPVTTTIPAPTPVDTRVEDGSEEPPPRIAVPPRTTPRVVTAVDQAVAKVLEEQLRAAQQTASEALAASQAADQALAVLEAEQSKMHRSFEALHVDEAAAAQRLIQQRQRMRTRAVAVYVTGPSDPVIPVGNDIHEYGRRRVLVQALHSADRRTLTQYVEAKNAAGGGVDTIVNRLEELNGKVLAARAESEARAAATQNGLRSVGTAQAGGRVAISGFAFPVAAPHNFASTFGAPRSGGRLHQGNDIFAPYGTPLYAAERGVVSQMGTNSLGGIKLWVTGESGTSYYYAHLSAFVIGVVDGSLVGPGDVVGFVGNTGNAISTPPHLHFEIHPGGGPAIDPYAILKAADEATDQQAAQPPVVPAAPPITPSAAEFTPAIAAAVP